jgi:hypothetical protein
MPWSSRLAVQSPGRIAEVIAAVLDEFFRRAPDQFSRRIALGGGVEQEPHFIICPYSISMA